MGATPNNAYHESLMRRLQMIDELGSMQTALTQPAAMPQINLPGVSPNPASGGAPGGSLGAFINAITGQESGGNYSAVNRHSGAMGKYQIMPGNIRGAGRGWDYEALGRDISTAQFMKSPQLQDAIAQYKLKQYYQKWGPAGAAVAWYAGPGTVSNYLKNPSRYTNPQGAYPSIAAYVNAILRRMRG